MTDTPLFDLDTEGRFRLAYDENQWIVQKRKSKPTTRRFGGRTLSDSGWRAVWFVGSKKSTLTSYCAGMELTPEALANLDALPDFFPRSVQTAVSCRDGGVRRSPIADPGAPPGPP